MLFNAYVNALGYATLGGAAVLTLRWLCGEIHRRRFLTQMQDAYEKAFGGSDD